MQQRKAVVLTARVHPGETNASWMMKGFLDFLLSGSKEAKVRSARCSTAVLLLLLTRHRASTSMYLLTFCFRVMSPERHRWKLAVQAAAVMLRTPPIDGQLPASQPRALAIYGAQF